MNMNIAPVARGAIEPVDRTLRHYEDLLAPYYVWMGGASFEDQVAQQRALLAGLRILGSKFETAIDLGCGPGYQSLALAHLGFSRILALDACQGLLDILIANKADHPIEVVRSDIRCLLFHAEPASQGTVLCMGDTLTDLESRLEVSWLLAAAQVVLAPGGVLVLTFCDYSMEPIEGERVKQVRGDASRVVSCFLEYERDKVVVNDLIHVRGQNGWNLRTGYYRKLRLDPTDIVDELIRIGFAVLHDAPIGKLHTIVMQKPMAASSRLSVFLGGGRF